MQVRLFKKLPGVQVIKEEPDEGKRALKTPTCIDSAATAEVIVNPLHEFNHRT